MDEATIEFAILANHVEVHDNMFYISGGGWIGHRRFVEPGGVARSSRIGIAVSVLVPWNETNHPHVIAAHLENEDGQMVGPGIEMQIRVGRAPSLPQGEEQRIPLALALETTFPAAGKYRLVVSLNNESSVKRVGFWVFDVVRPSPLG